jgi:hypothetical protein
LKFSVFFNSQQEKDLANNDFLSKIKDLPNFAIMANFYLSFCCQLGYHKIILENLNEDFH